MQDHALLDHPGSRTQVHAATVLHPFPAPVSVVVTYPGPLLVVYSAVPPASVRPGWSRRTLIGQTKTRFRVRSGGTGVKWDGEQS